MFTALAFIKRKIILPLQKLLIAGNFTSFRTTSYGDLVKTTPTTAIDTTFNMGSGTNGSIYASAIDENGKILIVGNFSTYSGSTQNFLTRINTDGTRDTTFNIGAGFSNTTWAVLPVSQSKVLVGGNWGTSYSSSASTRIARINSNGTLDTTFNPPALTDVVYTVATQSDGKIIAGGNFQYAGYAEPFLAKITPQLNPDTTFNPGSGPNGSVYAFATQSDGKIIMGGTFTTYSGSTSPRIVRINTDGTRDATFNVGTAGLNAEADVIRVQSNGKVLVGGSFTTYSGSSSPRIIRLNSDGTRDTSFSVGTGFNGGQIYDIQIQSDGQIIVVGTFSGTYNGTSQRVISRIGISGSLDTTFNVPGSAAFAASQYSCAIQSDGKIVVGGLNSAYNGAAALRLRRLNTNGTNDATFAPPVGNTVYRVKIQPDQKILILGTFSTFTGAPTGTVNRIMRLNTDGTRDTTFNSGTGFNSVTQILSGLELDSSGSIYVGSNFATFSGSVANSFVKLNSSGSLITGSGLYSGFDSAVNSLLVDSTGSVYAGGGFNNYLSLENRIIRLNTDGTKDSSFQVGTGFNTTVINLVVQSDDKIVVGGNFTSYSGSANNYIVRLNANGTKDTSFNLGNGFSSFVYKVFLQSDNKILVGGIFTSYSGSSNNNLVRINPNGTKDTSFNIGTGTNSSQFPIGIVQDQSGNIHYGNVNMTSYSGSSVTGYVKLTSSGSIDPTFLSTAANANSLPGAYTQGAAGTGVYSISIDSSNNAYLFGNFQNYLVAGTGRVLALDLTQGNVSIPPNFGTGFNNSIYYSSPTPSGDIWLTGDFNTYKGSSLNSSTVVKIDSQGTLINTSSFTSAGFALSLPSAIFAQSDGKCLVAFMNIYGLADMVRLNSNGTLDTTFASSNYPYGYGYGGEIRAIKQQSNGDILFGGSFYGLSDDGEGGYNQEYPLYLTKYNSSGSFLGLNYPLAAGYVNNINLLPDNSFIVTGYSFYTGGGFIQKWDSTGSIDSSYNSGSFNGEVYTSTLQPDQKIIAAGAFTTYSGSTVNRLARINTNGTLDITFNPGSGFDVFNSRFSKIVVDQENNIHVVGPFTTYSGSQVNGYVKLAPNGNLLPAFDGTISTPIGVYTQNFPNKDAYTMESLNY